MISYSHDPDHRHLESFGVMGDSGKDEIKKCRLNSNNFLYEFSNCNARSSLLQVFMKLPSFCNLIPFSIFTRWHAYIDDIFQAHKAQLPPYTAQQLTYPGITVSDVLIQAEGGRPNIINTHWQQSDLNLAKGRDRCEIRRQL